MGDITEDTEDTMDGAATTDTPTDTDTTVWDTVDTMDILTTTWENALLMLNPKLMPNPRLRLHPGTDTMVDTTVIPTTGAITDTDTDTMVVTGGNLSVANPSRI